MRARRPGAPGYLILGLIAVLAAGCRNSTRDVVAEVEQAAAWAEVPVIGVDRLLPSPDGDALEVPLELVLHVLAAAVPPQHGQQPGQLRRREE